MKKVSLLLLSLIISVLSFAAKQAPQTENSFTGAGSYCQGGTATPLVLNYTTCNSSATLSPGGVACNYTWYYNPTATNVLSGSSISVSNGSFTSPSTGIFGGTATGSLSYTPSLSTTGTRYYFVRITWSASSCNSANLFTSSVAAVTVNANPTSASATASPTTLCAGSTLNLSGSQSGGAGTPTFSWTGPGYGGSSLLSPGGFSVTSAGTGIYTLTITTPGCTPITRTTSSVTVNTVPTSLSASNTPFPVCAGQNLSLNGSATGATSYSWSGPGYGGSVASNPPGFTSSVSNSGIFTFSATNSCGTSSLTTTVNVVTTPPSGVTASATPNPICTGASLSLLGSATNATSFSWSGPSGSGYTSALASPPAFTSTSSHAGVFTLTATNGCGSSQATTTVSLGPLPAITSANNPAWVCAPISIFSEGWESGVLTTSGTPVDGWNTSATSTTYYSQQSSASYPSVSGGHSGTYFCKFNSFNLSTIGEAYGALRSPSFSMVGVSNASLSFWVYREVGGSYPSSSGFGVEGFKIYINTTTTAGGTQLGWVPRAADATPTGVTGTANPGSSGWYQYSVTIPGAYSGATNYIFFSGVSAYGDDCYLDDISLIKTMTTNVSIGTGGGSWSTSNSSIATINSSGVVYGVSAGTATISYSVSGCALPSTATIGVVSSTPAITAAGSPTLLCIGSSVTMSGTYSGGSWSASNGNASVTSGGVVTGVSAGTVTITYALGCGAVSTYNLTIVGSPNPITGTNYTCVGSTTTLSSTTTGYTWSSSNSEVASVAAATGAVTGVSAGTVNISYSTGCGTDAYTTYTVNPVPAAISGVASICTLTVSAPFTDASTGITNTWSNSPTTYGTINSSTGVFTSGSTVGTTTITYTSTYANGSCYATVPLSVSNTAPVAITPGSASVCTGSSVTLSDGTPGGAWTVDPGSSAVATVTSSGMVTGLSQGVATISYSACGSVTRDVTVTGYSGSISSNSPLCTGSTLSLTSSISPTPTYSWSGPGFTSSLANPTRTSATTAYSGVYSLAVSTGGCARTFTTTVSVSALAVTITPSTASFCSGGATSLTAVVTGAATPVSLTEGWESGVPTSPGTLVDGWNTTATTTTYFSRQSAGSYPVVSGGHSGTYFNKFNSYNINPGSGLSAAYGAMVSPSFSMLGMNGTVSCWIYREVGGSYTTGSYLNEGFKIYVNTTGSVTGATLLGFVPRCSAGTPTGVSGTANPSTSGWYQYTVAIPGTFVGVTNYILFEGISAYGDDCYLDDIAITTTPTSAVWTPTTRLYTNAGLTAPYSSAINTVYAAPTTSTNYSATVGTCTSSPAVITVAPQPSISSLTPSASTICYGQSVSIVATTSGGLGTATYTWSGPAIATTAGATSTSPALTPTMTGASNYSLTLSYSGTSCNATTSSTSVTNNALPVASPVSAPSLYCIGSGAPITLTTTTPVSGVGSLVSYNWSGPAGFSATTAPGSPFVTLTPTSTASSGIYSLTVTYSSASCTSNPVSSSSITIGTTPSIYTVTGGSGCSAGGVNVGLSGSDSSGVNYTLKRGGTVISTISGTTTTLSFGSIAAAGIYSVTASDAAGCTANMAGTATVNVTPSAAISAAMPNICQPTTSASVGLSSITGAPNAYSVVWNTVAHSDGLFSDITAATLSGSSVTLNFNPSGGAGSFDGTMTLSNGSCTSPSYPIHVIVHANPAVSVSAVNVPCVGYAGSIDFTGTDSATVSYSVNGGSATSFNFNGTTHNLNTGVITSARNYLIIDAHNAVCTTAVGTTVTIDPTPMAWIGGTATHESEWNQSTNWSCGFVPTVADDVQIGASLFDPLIPSSFTATTKNLTIASGGVLNIDGGGQVSVKGTYNNSNSVAGSGKVVLNGSTNQDITGIGKTSNLELDNTNGATIQIGSRLVIGNTLTITAGTLMTNDSLELASTDTNNTARIATLPSSGASITGKVKVDQYVMGGYRRFRFFAHPFRDTMSLSQLQKYIDITGSGGVTNGFTSTGSNAPSAFRLDPYTSNSSIGYDPGWKAFSKINSSAADSNKVHPGQGIRLFFRGAKGEGLGYGALGGGYTPSSVTYKMLGNVNQGDVSISLSQGSDTAHQSFNMVGNPYPSSVDMGKVIWRAREAGQVTGSAFYVFDPAIGAGGNFIIISLGASSVSGGSPISYYVQANTCIQVRAASDGAHIDFTENDKVVNSSLYLYKTPSQYSTLAVYDEQYHLWDKLLLDFNDKATDNEDRSHDAVKPIGVADFNFYSTSSDNRKLALDSRPFAAEKVIPLGVSSGYQQNFIIRADYVAVPAGGKLVLHDKLLCKYVELNAGTEYAFTIGKDTATQGDRFELAMRTSTPAVVKPLTVSMTPNPATDDVKISFTSGKKEQVSVRVIDISGVSVYNKDLGEQQNGTISIPLSTFAAGIYMVELTQGDQKVTQRLVKE